MTQAKLEQRVIAICPFVKRNPESHRPSPLGICVVCDHALKFARAELRKAAEIAEKLADHEAISKYAPSIENPLLVAQLCKEIGIAIRKLME